MPGKKDMFTAKKNTYFKHLINPPKSPVFSVI